MTVTTLDTIPASLQWFPRAVLLQSSSTQK
jgi:hypothetical protein